MKSRNRSNAGADLNQIHLFVEVLRAGSFAQAARRLGVPANSLSRKIQQLEDRLGSRLLHRSTRKLTPTTAGTAFYDRCADSVSELAQAAQAAVDSDRAPGGLVRVAAPADFFDVFRLEWIAEFLAAYPQVRIEFVLDDAKTDLIAASIDVAFRAKHLVDARHGGQKLFDTHFRLVASPTYLAVRGWPARPEALADHDCLPQSGRSGAVIWHLKGPEGSLDVAVAGRFRANTARVVLQSAVAGLGIALLPDLVTAPELQAGRLLRVLPRWRREGADLHTVYVSDRQVPRGVAAFVAFATAKIRSLLPPRRLPQAAAS